MLALLLNLALAQSRDADLVDAQWRAMQVLRARPDAYRVIKEPITIERGPVKLVLEQGVMVPVFSGFHARDRDGIRQARAEAFALDSKAPPPLEEGQVEFVGFVFTAATGSFEVSWQERADHLIFANHQVTHLGQDREDWAHVARGEPWTGTVKEGFVLDASEEVMRAFLGPDAPEDASPYDVVVYGERDYSAARLRARILFHDRREQMMRDGFHAGRGVAWDRVARLHGLQTRGEHSLIDLHIDQNVGAMDMPPGRQPNDIDWITLRQDWTGVMDSRRHSVLQAFDIDLNDAVVSFPLTGVPFDPVDPDDPTSPPLPPARLETDEAYIVVQPVPVTAQLRVQVLARLKLRAVGGDFRVVQLMIPRAARHQHDWKLLSVVRDDGTPLISKAPLIEYNPGESNVSDSGSAPSYRDTSGQSGAPVAMAEGEARAARGSFVAQSGDVRKDATRGRPETRVTLSLPEVLRDGDTLVLDVTWLDRWPYGDAQFTEQGSIDGGMAVFSQTGAASGPQAVLPRPAGSPPEHPARYQIEVVVPERTALASVASGDTAKVWVADGYVHALDQRLDAKVPWPDVHVGAFTVHDEAAVAGFPAIRTRTFRKGDGEQLAAETRAQIDFLQGFLPPFPWKEHDIALGPGGVNQLWWAYAHGMTAAGVSGVTSVTDGGQATQQGGRHTTQLLMSHSLAHQWFGQSVRPAHPSDAWFAEAFAEAFATLYVGALHGSYDRIYKVKRRDFETALRRPLTRVPLTGAIGHPDEAAILEDYGPYVLQEMLRPRIGNERYHAAIDLVARDFAGKALTTEQLQRWFEEAAGEDLDDFFDFWIYGGFLPRKLILRWSFDAGTWTGELECDVPFGHFDVPVLIDGVAHTIDVIDGSGRLELPLDAAPEVVDLDPEHRVLAMRRAVRQRGVDPEPEEEAEP